MQEMLEAEMTEALGAGERQAHVGTARLGYPATMDAPFVARVGKKLELRVPQDREGRFSTELFERYPALGTGLRWGHCLGST